jgi:hypothetical protein
MGKLRTSLVVIPHSVCLIAMSFLTHGTEITVLTSPLDGILQRLAPERSQA